MDLPNGTVNRLTGMPDPDREVPLGGLITAAVRVGNTVRRPAAPGTAVAAALLRYLGRPDSPARPGTWDAMIAVAAC